MGFTEETRAKAREIMARYPAGRERSALLPMLHLVQSEQGYVSADGMAFCAELLGITKAQVAAVATFYTMYKRRPVGDWLVSVCTNTMCGVLGGDKAFQALWEYEYDKYIYVPLFGLNWVHGATAKVQWTPRTDSSVLFASMSLKS